MIVDDVNTHDPLIFALDFESAREADSLVNALGDSAGFYKVGMELYAATGMDYVRSLTDRGKRVFLDMKYYDIGETVRRAVSVAAKSGATFLTVHAVGQVMRAAMEGRGDSDLKLLAVTVLTSLDDKDLKEMGPLEASAIRKIAGQDAILVTPGVRSRGAAAGDQKRVATPAEALRDGASYLVIGRQVTRSADPVAALAAIRAEIGAELAIAS